MKLPVYIQQGRELISLNTQIHPIVDHTIRVYDEAPNEHHYYQGKVVLKDDSDGPLFLHLKISQDHSVNRPSWRPRTVVMKFDEPFLAEPTHNVIIILNAAELQPDNNPYYGRHNFSVLHDADFEYMDVKEYATLQDWLDNVFILEIENTAFNTFNTSIISFMDKRSGVKHSKMKASIKTPILKEIQTN